MNQIKSYIYILLLFSAIQSMANESWKNTSLSFEERTDCLLSKLTIEEKIQLMRFDSPSIERLGIPAYNWWNECLHGVARSGLATVFPQAIGMAAMWDKDLMLTIGNVISDEARAKYNDYQRQRKRGIYQGLTFWTPNINIFRDPRWGRGMETYGEDPYLTSEVAIPFIKGLQGNDPHYLKLVATVKHFAVHSGPESTRHSADVWPNDYDLAETYLPHFKRTVEESGVYSVMCAYQRLNGMPCCGSKFLDNILRNDWNFKGYIVSDCGAIQDFYEKKAHHVVNTPEAAAAMAVQAGTDLNCGSVYAKSLLNAVKQGLVSEAEINTSVKRLIMARMKLGQFDPNDKVKYAQIPLSVVDCQQHRDIALESARKSLVLIKNDNNMLPFSKNVKNVAVIGPNADNKEILLGNYNGYPAMGISPLQGIISKLPNAQVKFAQGCRLAEELPYLTVISPKYLFTNKTLQNNGVNAEYFSDKNFKGNLKHQCIDKNIDFVWRTKSPFKDMQPDSFSVRWKTVLVPPVTGKYALGAEAFYGFDVFINGKRLLHGNRNEHEPGKAYEFIDLEAGKSYEIEFDYFENNTEYATARLMWDIPNPKLKEEAIELARRSDIVVLCMGLSPMLEGEEMKIKVPGFDHGDRLDIQLPACQTDLIREIQKLGKPTALILLNGSALAFNWEAENLSAILEAWYPGQAGGTAVADVLFGDYNPSGRLPVTFYKNINQIPAFDDYNMKGKTYRYFEDKPLYEFGYGLSYSTFKYAFKNIPSEIKTGEKMKISVDITNTGKVNGEEVVQLYVSLPDSKLQKPIRSLQGFKRIYLKVGETQTVQFELLANQFAARDFNNNQVVEAGKVLVSVGGKQPDAVSIANKNVIVGQVKVVGDKITFP